MTPKVFYSQLIPLPPKIFHSRLIPMEPSNYVLHLFLCHQIILFESYDIKSILFKFDYPDTKKIILNIDYYSIKPDCSPLIHKTRKALSSSLLSMAPKHFFNNVSHDADAIVSILIPILPKLLASLILLIFEKRYSLLILVGFQHRSLWLQIFCSVLISTIPKAFLSTLIPMVLKNTIRLIPLRHCFFWDQKHSVHL